MQYGLTSRQLKLYKFVKSYIAKKTISPSFDEMKKAVGLKSKSGVKQIVDQLQPQFPLILKGFEKVPYKVKRQKHL